MATSFDEMLADGSPEAVVKLAALEETADQVAAACKLTQLQLKSIHDYVLRHGSRLGTKTIVTIGCVIHLHDIATGEHDSVDLQEKLLEDLGVKRTQGFRLKNVWRHCGPALMAEPELLDLFCVESLKLISGPNVGDEARAACCDRARSGERITIKVAKELIDLFREPDVPSSEATEDADKEPEIAPVAEDDTPTDLPTPTTTKSKMEPADVAAVEAMPLEPQTPETTLLTFRGSVVRFVVEPIVPSSSTKLDDVVADVEEFLSVLKRKRERVIQAKSSTAAEVGVHV